MKMKSYAVVDQETGQIVAENFIFFGKAVEKTDRNFVKFFMAFFADVLNDKEVIGKAIRLFLYMTTRLDFNNNVIILFPNEAQRDLNISKDTFYRWLRVLIRKGLVKKLSEHKYELTPTVIKGTTYKRDLKEKYATVKY